MPAPVTTLAVDIGGTGLKAAVLDGSGAMCGEQVRVPTPRPADPDTLVAALCALVAPLLPVDRVSVGFPGMVRAGRVLSAPNLVRPPGGDGAPDPDAVAAWAGFSLAAVLESEFGAPTHVVNDASMQGAAVIGGSGLELVATLGTGFGTALFYDGKLTPHLELAHHPLHDGETYDQHLGDAARERVGEAAWNRRVARAVDTLDNLTRFDHLYLGGGNSRRVTVELGARVSLVDNVAGILGGFRLWGCDPI
jgi:polyphosphate glucokinase